MPEEFEYERNFEDGPEYSHQRRTEEMLGGYAHRSIRSNMAERYYHGDPTRQFLAETRAAGLAFDIGDAMGMSETLREDILREVRASRAAMRTVSQAQHRMVRQWKVQGRIREWRRESVPTEDDQTVRALVRILVRLGMGSQRVDESNLEQMLIRAEREIADLQRQVLHREQEAVYVTSRGVRYVEADSHPSAHDHFVQYKILNIDDEVVDSSEWLNEHQQGGAEQQWKGKVLDRQTVGEDVFLKTYHKCNHVNLTVQIDREQ